MTILTPQEFFKEKRFVSKESIFAFILSVIIGILTHIYPLTHRFFNEDYHYAYQANFYIYIKMGRWFYAFLNSYLNDYIVPSLTTLIVIIFYALMVVLLINVFKIKENFIIFVFSGVIMAFPAIASAIGYMFSIENSSTAIFLSTLGFYLANRSRKCAIIGAVPLCFALGGYQAYIALPITLCLISLLLLTLDNDTTIKEITNKILDFLIFGIIGVGLYFLITKAFLNYYNLELTTYAGLNEMGEIPIESIPGLISDTYKGYFNYIFGRRFLNASKLIIIVNLIFIILNIYLFIICIIKSNINKNPYKIVLSLIFFLLLPFAYNSLDFLSNNINSILGTYPFVFTYLFPFILISKYNLNNINNINSFHINILKLNSWVISICIIIMIFNFVKITNIYYHKVEIAYGNTVGIINRMIMKIDETESFNYEIPIAFAGSLKESHFYDYNFLFDYDETTFVRGLRGQYVGFSKETDLYKFVNLCNNYFGTRYKASNVDLNKIKTTEEYLNMQEYPKTNSIKIIDGTLIIKLSYNQHVGIKKGANNTYSFRYETDEKSFDHNKYTYGWYVYKNGVTISKVNYNENDVYTHQFKQSGDYQIKVFVRNKETSLTEFTVLSDIITVK